MNRGLDNEYLHVNDEFTQPDFEKISTYVPLVTSLFVSMVGITAVIYTPSDVFGPLVLIFLAFFFLLSVYSSPISTKPKLSPNVLYVIFLSWFIHGAIFRNNKHIIDDDATFYLSLLGSFLGILTATEWAVATLTRTCIFAIALFSINVIPHHEQNVFHIDESRVYFRIGFTYIVYWASTIDTVISRRCRIDKDFEPATRFRLYRHLVLRDVVRVAWIPFLPDMGLIIIVFIMVIIITFRVIWPSATFQRMVEDIEMEDEPLAQE